MKRDVAEPGDGGLTGVVGVGCNGDPGDGRRVLAERGAEVGGDAALDRHPSADPRRSAIDQAKNIHVLGDATLSGRGMPKSGHMANQHAKVAAAAIVELLNGRAPNPAPLVTNTCYSYVSDKEAVHVAGVYNYDPKDKTFKTVAGSGGVSRVRNELEGVYGWAWAQNIWSDMLG